MSRASRHGFFPQISIEDGVKETIRWYLKNKELADKTKDVFKSLKEGV